LREKKLAESFGIPYVETSAKTRINIDESFLNLLMKLTVMKKVKKPKNQQERTQYKEFAV